MTENKTTNKNTKYAAIEALKNKEVDKKINEMVKEYNERRTVAMEELNNYNLKMAACPEGAYYIIVDVRKYSENSLEFAYELLENARVAVTPGIDFGSNLEGYIRISYATSKEQIREGIKRLGEYLNKK